MKKKRGLEGGEKRYRKKEERRRENERKIHGNGKGSRNDGEQ
jgi:hypothetical protein